MAMFGPLLRQLSNVENGALVVLRLLSTRSEQCVNWQVPGAVPVNLSNM